MKGKIIGAIVKRYPNVVVFGLEETHISIVPEGTNAFILAFGDKWCTCTPRCRKEAIVLFNGTKVAVVLDYSQLDQAVAAMVASSHARGESL